MHLLQLASEEGHFKLTQRIAIETLYQRRAETWPVSPVGLCYLLIGYQICGISTYKVISDTIEEASKQLRVLCL